MPLPYDATLKDLAQASPRGLLEEFDAPPHALPVELLNVDLSTITSSTDLVFGLGEPIREILHMEFQSSASATKHLDIPVYNTLLHRQFAVPVHSVVVLLRPQAAHPNLNGRVVYAPRPDRGKVDMEYEVVRLWERPASKLLAGDLGVVPLAPLGQLPAEIDQTAALAQIINQMIERLEREAPIDKARRLLTASFVLTGLRVPRETAFELFKGATSMRDSDTYLAIVDEGIEKGIAKGIERGIEQGIERGRFDEVSRLIRKFGRKKFGTPGKRVTAALDGIADIARLERMLERIQDVESWQELLAVK